MINRDSLCMVFRTIAIIRNIMGMIIVRFFPSLLHPSYSKFLTYI